MAEAVGSVHSWNQKMQTQLLHVSLMLLYFKEARQPQSSLDHMEIISLQI